MKGSITMNVKEVNRIAILEKVMKREIKQNRGASLLGISVRQIRRLVKKYRKDGAVGIIHKLRGVPSNHRGDPDILDTALMTIIKKYHDFSVTFAHEKLVELHNFPYSRETLRGAMIVANIWKPTRQSVPIVHTLRDRRPSEGELVQIDGSPHLWFEARGPSCTLLVYIDDATGKLLWLEFVVSETTNAYFLATRHYLEHHGKPLAFYSDKHGVFRVNTTKAGTAATDDSNGLTQFGIALKELAIKPIFANSPQAKGRVEKVNQTLQDRLVKELRLLDINTLTECNRFLPAFIEAFNQRFAVIPKSSINLHRPLTPQDSLGDILVQKHTRRLSKQLTLSYENQIYQIMTDRPTYAMRHATVIVQEDATGVVSIWYHQTNLNYRIIEKNPPSEIVDSKHINIVVNQTKERVWGKPSPTHPWKQAYLYW